MNEEDVEKRLKNIYSMIPDFECKNCHNCCGPILWFEAENNFIKKYLKNHNMKEKIWTEEQFKENNMRCPYIKDDICSIYPVRPIVCRLQGHTEELPCKYNKKTLSKNKIFKIKNEFNKLINDLDKNSIFYSSKRYIK